MKRPFVRPVGLLAGFLITCTSYLLSKHALSPKRTQGLDTYLSENHAFSSVKTSDNLINASYADRVHDSSSQDTANPPHNVSTSHHGIQAEPTLNVAPHKAKNDFWEEVHTNKTQNVRQYESSAQHLTEQEYVDRTPIDMYLAPALDCTKPHTLIILVCSLTLSYQRRQRVRETWGQLSQYTDVTEQSFNLQILFFLGELKHSPELEREAATHKDLWVGRFPEHYLGLTRKGVYVLDWVDRQCDLSQNVDYVFKTDDDVYVNLYVLLPPLWETIKAKRKVHFVCKIMKRVPVLREGKWSESKLLWPYRHWPVYCQGIGYFISQAAMPLVLNGMHDRHLCTNEDIFFTGIVVTDASKPPPESPSVVYKHIPGRLRYDYNVDYGENKHTIALGMYEAYQGHVLSHKLTDTEWYNTHRLVQSEHQGGEFTDF